MRLLCRVSIAAILALVAASASADAHATTRPLARLQSADLRAVHAAIAHALADARHAAPGQHTAHVDGHARRLGRTYEERAFHLGDAGADEARVLDAAHVWLHPDLDDEAWFEHAAPLGTGAADASAAFAVERGGFALPVPAAEITARDALAGAVRDAARTHASLHVLGLRCGWGDVVGGAYLGLIVIDPTTREALWVLSHETWNDE